MINVMGSLMKCFEIVRTGIRFSNDIEKIKLIKIKIMRKKEDFVSYLKVLIYLERISIIRIRC
jgi:hypothetical protein